MSVLSAGLDYQQLLATACCLARRLVPAQLCPNVS